MSRVLTRWSMLPLLGPERLLAERGAQLGDLVAQLGKLALEAIEPRLGLAGNCDGRLSRRVRPAADELLIALLLLTRQPRMPGDELALDQLVERLMHRGKIGEGVEP